MPSQRSLVDSRYYAHPRNAFWWIMSRLLGFAESINYHEKCQHLRSSNIALWDVLNDCQRLGSLDSNIQRDTEQVNDFDEFFKNHQNITLIAFNGAAAKQIFMRHCGITLSTLESVKTVQLPSTSPAHASLSREQKLHKWRDALDLF